MSSIERRENESLLGYYKRIIDNRKEYDLDYAEIGNIILGDTKYSSDNVRKAVYLIKPMLENLENERIDSLEDNDVIVEQKEILRDIKIERNKLRVEKQEVDKLFRDYSRVDLRFDKVNDAINNLKPLDIPNPIIISEGYKEGVLPITDQHFGKNVLVKGLKNEIINEYNEEIFADRMEDLLNKVISICDKENINKIHTLFLGDAIEGMLRQSTLMQLKNGMIDQTMQYAEYMANWLNKLSQYIKIDIHYTLGNHSEARVLNCKSGDFPQENMERIIMFYLKTRLNDNPNIDFLENETGFIYCDVLGYKILGSHGHEKDLERALKDYSRMYREDINMLITGHLHHSFSQEIGVDTEIVRVRSICGIDDYSMKLRRMSNAGTSLMVFEEGIGKTITYDIKL